MHVTALQTDKPRKRFPIIPFTILLTVVLLPTLSTAQDDARASWDQWLDSAYQLTWHDRADIKEWLVEKEATVFDMPLDNFVQEQEKRLAAAAQTGLKPPVTDETVIQLAIAQMLLYLKNTNSAYLDNAVQTLRFLKPDALEKPETLFWHDYIHAHSAMEKGNASEFVRNTFHIWLNVVLKVETTVSNPEEKKSDSALHGFYRSPSYLYRNLANLILQRAILQSRLRNIDALGVIIRNLSYRMPPTGYGKWVGQVADYMGGPESDVFRLVFTVHLIDAEGRRIELEKRVTAKKINSTIATEIADLFSRYERLTGIASTRHGQMIALVKQLQLTSFILFRLEPGKQHREIVSSIPVMGNPSGIPDTAIRLFDELASLENRREMILQNGFLSHKAYLSAMHGLWRAIMNAGLDTAVYYNRRIDSSSSINLRSHIPLLEQPLIRYLDFFNRYADAGYRPIVPDNAFYGAVESTEMLSNIYFLSAQWESGLKKYDWALARRIQALEIFPFGVSGYQILARRLMEIGRLEQYRQYVTPLADRIRGSRLIQAAAIPQNEYLGEDLNRLVTVLPEVIERAPYSIVLHQGLQQVPQELVSRMTAIEAEIQSLSMDAQSRKQTLETTRNLRQELGTRKVLTREAVPALSQDIELLAGLMEKNQRPQPEMTSDRQLPSFDTRLFTDDLPQIAQELRQIREECIILQQLPDMTALRNRLVMEADHPFHTLLRNLYYENIIHKSGYRTLLQSTN